MSYLIIADILSNGRPNRTNIKSTKEEAEALVKKLINDMPVGKEAPDAFYVENPNIDLDFVIADPLTKSITVNLIAKSAQEKINSWMIKIQESDSFLSRSREDLMDHLINYHDKCFSSTLKTKWDKKKEIRSRRPIELDPE